MVGEIHSAETFEADLKRLREGRNLDYAQIRDRRLHLGLHGLDPPLEVQDSAAAVGGECLVVRRRLRRRRD